MVVIIAIVPNIKSIAPWRVVPAHDAESPLCGGSVGNETVQELS